MLIRLCLDMRGICVQDLSSYQLFLYTLPKDLVEYLLRNIVIPESPSGNSVKSAGLLY